ncbi:hypothetical protein BDB01DRAFT_770605 [Pilobolus umbonatus]|nr:hypothetical protein BDB01DRAFT_770605 [Pilobolus umbonatus]
MWRFNFALMISKRTFYILFGCVIKVVSYSIGSIKHGSGHREPLCSRELFLLFSLETILAVILSSLSHSHH